MKKLKTLFLSIITALAVAAIAYAWTSPSGNPPSGGGALYYYNNNVGIGTPTPGAKLEVVGDIKITGGTPSAGEVLTSDATGLATWEMTSSIPSGAVMFFDLSSCPSGWTELVNAQGRYLVGLPGGGTLNGEVGQVLTNLENRAVGQHGHNITDPAHSHTYSGIWGGSSMPYNQTGGAGYASQTQTAGAGTGITVQNTGAVPGTNAPYIQLRVCKKS